jgi:NADP-dependent 3-hydroxy acid dehydrogenase YdfG
MQLSSDIAAIVTGAASGLGEATARALAARGVRVAVLDRDAKGRAGRGEIRRRLRPGGRHLRRGSRGRLRQGPRGARQERILVNCAGVANAMKTVGRDKETKAVKRYPIHQFELPSRST